MNEKTKSILAYIFGLIGGLIVLFMKDSQRNTKIHAAQSLTLSIIYYLFILIQNIALIQPPLFKTLLSIAYVGAVLFGILNAYNDKDPEIPIIGDIAINLFKKQIDN